MTRRDSGSGILTQRRLNRALLARQMLLERRKVPATEAIQQLVGLQAQLPRPPFVGLWTRLQKFDRGELLKLARERKVVRATAMRGTLHVMTVPDFLLLRPALAEMLVAGAASIVGKQLAGVDLEGAYAAGRRFFENANAPFESFRQTLEDAYGKSRVRAVAYAVRMGVPLVSVPGDAAWGWSPAAGFTLAESWLGRQIPERSAALDQLVLRYLAAFGPASIADAQTWSGIRVGGGRLREVFERMRSRLVTFRDEDKRELFDLPDAPRPPEDAPAPVRFLPEFDNVLLSHDDRSRIMSDADRKKVVSKNLQVAGTFTVDGFVAGTWRVAEKKRTAALVLQPFRVIPRLLRQDVEEEGLALARFVAPEAGSHEVAQSR